MEQAAIRVESFQADQVEHQKNACRPFPFFPGFQLEQTKTSAHCGSLNCSIVYRCVSMSDISIVLWSDLIIKHVLDRGNTSPESRMDDDERINTLLCL